MSASGSRFSSVARACRELTQVQVQGSPSSRSSSSCALVHLRKRARLERPWPLDVGRTLSASPRRASRKVVALQRGLGGAPVRKFVPPRRRRRGRVLHAVGAEHSAQQELVPGDDHLPFLIDARRGSPREPFRVRRAAFRTPRAAFGCCSSSCFPAPAAGLAHAEPIKFGRCGTAANYLRTSLALNWGHSCSRVTKNDTT
mmetsp:Transcript_19778/g.58868  ORF Transcript_19778/g.58868 Transcript_19778/m.58868 type:complete len:200 (-) Transcript_19778:28-627(-)